MDVICGVESALQEGIEHHDRCLSTLVLACLLCTSDGVCVMVMSRSVLMGRYSLGGVVLFFILDRIRAE